VAGVVCAGLVCWVPCVVGACSLAGSVVASVLQACGFSDGVGFHSSSASSSSSSVCVRAMQCSTLHHPPALPSHTPAAVPCCPGLLLLLLLLCRFVWEAVSHEVGHTLGLSHDGQVVNGALTGYYAGQGDWAPIMVSATLCLRCSYRPCVLRAGWPLV
jgi:hypothetical protein